MALFQFYQSLKVDLQCSLLTVSVDVPLLKLAPTAGGIGHSKITEALSCVYSSFDYGQNIELDVESLVSTFARSTPQTVVSPTQTNESKEVHDTLHHLFVRTSTLSC